MVVPSQGLQSKSLHEWANFQGASLVVFTSSENEATKAESFPSFVQLLPREIAGKIRPVPGGEGFLLIVLS